MILTLVFGFIAGIVAVCYRGLYFGPWNEALNTMGACLAAAVFAYIILQILAGIGSFFLKLVIIVILTIIVLFGGTRLWNTFNPDSPIDLIDYASKPFQK